MKISGSIVIDPCNVLSEEKSFYQKLYSTSKNYNADNLQTANAFMRRQNNFRRMCQNIWKFQKNKAPGNDGIPVKILQKKLATY